MKGGKFNERTGIYLGTKHETIRILKSRRKGQTLKTSA